jgi:hypothetical protein
MKLIILTWVAAALLLAQEKDSKQSKDGGKSEAPQAASAADPVASVIPKGATQLEPNLFRYTDAQGKTWYYRRFPFGVSKWEDKPVEQRAVEEPLAGVVRDLGDRVEFQRKTPFGISKWVSKKTDFSDDEKEMMAAYQAKRAGISKDGDKTADKSASDKSASDKSKDKQENK